MRKPVKELHRAQALEDVEKQMKRIVEIKGNGSFASFHELRGVLDEEITEVYEAMHQRNRTSIERELKDLAVAAVFGLACIRAGALP